MRNKLILLITILALVGCYDDFDNTIVDVVEETPPTTMETALTGKILNVQDEDVAEYRLEVGSTQIKSGQKAFYHYINPATKKGQVVKLYQNDDFVGIANALLIENDINYLEIKPFSNIGTSIINSNETNVVTVEGKVQFDIVANAFLDEASNEITGQIESRFNYSVDLEILNQIGSLAFEGDKSLITQNEAVFFIEFQEGNNSVKLKAEQATVTFKNLEQEGKSLFKFNKQGQLLLIQNNIELDKAISIDSDGVFLIAEYEEGVYSEGSIIKDVNKVSYMPFEVNASRSYSTAKGRWAQVLPKSNNVSIDLLSPCKNVLESQVLDLKDVEFKNYELNLSDNSDLVYNIKTKVINCDGDVEEIQAININADDNSFIYVFNQDVVDTWIPICKTEFEISGIEQTLNNSGPQFSWSIDINDELTILSGCDSFDEGFGYVVINDEERVYSSIQIESNQSRTSLKSSEYIRLHFDGFTQGIYEEEKVRISINDPDFGDSGYKMTCEADAAALAGCGIENFNVTHFEDKKDGWIRVSFSGELWAQTLSPPVAGNYPINGVILTKVD